MLSPSPCCDGCCPHDPLRDALSLSLSALYPRIMADRSAAQFSFAIITKKLVMIGWCFKYLHVIFDTLILMGALWAQQRHEQENLPSFSVAKSGSGDARSICDCNRSLASAGAVSEGSRRAVTPTENSGDTHQKSHLRPEDISNIDISDDKGASSRSSVTGMERAGAGAPSEVQYPSVVSGVR